MEGSDKLLRFRLDAGDEGHRQILSGIAKFYPNEQELVGKKLQIVANLKPRKMMKNMSVKTFLSAEHDGKLTVLTVDSSSGKWINYWLIEKSIMLFSLFSRKK